MCAAFIPTMFQPPPPLLPASFVPLVRSFRSSDSIFDPKTLRAVKRDSPSREIGKRFKVATFPTRSDKTSAPPYDRAAIHYRTVNLRGWKAEARQKPTATAKVDGRW